MPLEISEIGVHIAIGQAPSPTVTPTPTPGAPAAAPMTPAQVEAITNACVQQVLRTLRLREGR